MSQFLGAGKGRTAVEGKRAIRVQVIGEHCSVLSSRVTMGPEERASLFSTRALVSEGSLKPPGGYN
jgi:hypothetical protein